MEVESRVETEHQPIVIEIKEQRRNQERENYWKEVEDWTEEGKKTYKRNMKNITFDEKNEDTNKMMEELKDKIKEAIIRKKIKINHKYGNNKWWDVECRKTKVELRRWLKDMKKGIIREEDYKKKYKEYKLLIEEKKQKQEIKERKEIEEIKNESDVWKYLSKIRYKERNTASNISIETWREYFMNLYEAKDTNNRKEDEETEEKRKEAKKEEETVEIEEITEAEVVKQIKRLKNNKSPGEDKIKNEAWKNGNNKIRKRLHEIFNTIWKGKGIPNEWRQALIVPIYKRGDKETTSNYRGISLLNSSYKIYAAILADRLQQDLEEKEIIKDNQTGFRKGRGTMENIYILKHIIDREISQANGKIYAFFVDLQAAFDRIDRKQLWEIMRRKGINAHLIKRIKELYEETTNMVRVEEEVSKPFSTVKGLRQGCPLSPILFNIYLSDLEETMENWQAGGIKIGNKKIWSLSYADDIVLLAKTPGEMKDMMKRFERYIEKKNMILSPAKSKIVEFRTGRGREKKEQWKWKDQMIEQVKEVKYLGYYFQKNNGDMIHIRERLKKAKKAMGQVWSISERKFKNNYKMRMLMFDKLILSILLYGSEIWGWKEREEIEKQQIKYIKWTLKLDKQTPSYIITEETKRKKIRITTGKKAVSYETKIKQSSNEILKECWKEKQRNDETIWGTERRKFYERNGYSTTQIRMMLEEGEKVEEIVSERDKEIQMQEQQNRIDKTRYNEEYQTWKVPSLPRYLQRKDKHQRMIARFRCGNETRVNCFWNKDEDRKCRMCKEDWENLEHLKRCPEVREERRAIGRIMDDDGSGREWMREILERRKQIT